MRSEKPTFLNPRKPGVDRWLCAPVLLLLFLYKRLISPLLGNACRFHPTCSEYARQAYLSRPFLTACWLTIRRLAKCQPFHPGGYDPLDPDDEEMMTPVATTTTSTVCCQPPSQNKRETPKNG
ncbi:MAG TPA: membrane protein insertion efficiency factor YidD [Candidatus Sumerlaeota bacterium]|nr:membrane protein insertion efficiency factor YidD [Candidatus Sumerlaeota bacterium]HPS02719.1 membrane protein insertion efficiency factor YidD [Candidatus Sumerlaeota bacterium]